MGWGADAFEQQRTTGTTTMRKASLKIVWLLIFSAPASRSLSNRSATSSSAVKGRADDLDAKVLAPETYAAAIELYLSANDRMERGRGSP